MSIEYKKLPLFSPTNYVIKCRHYESPNGSDMVGTIEFYLPDINETVWVNCSEEVVSIYTADVIW